MKDTLLLLSLILVGTVTVNSCREKSNEYNESSANSRYYSVENAEEVAKEFAQMYLPDSLKYDGIGKLANVPDSVVSAFKVLRSSNSKAHNKWLTVIFLKLFLDHLRCCHQGYELRNSPSGGIDSIADQLLYEYLLSTKLFDPTNKHIEFINSGITQKWVDENPNLATDPDVKSILMAIKPLEDSIIRGLYW